MKTDIVFSENSVLLNSEYLHLRLQEHYLWHNALALNNTLYLYYYYMCILK